MPKPLALRMRIKRSESDGVCINQRKPLPTLAMGTFARVRHIPRQAEEADECIRLRRREAHNHTGRGRAGVQGVEGILVLIDCLMKRDDLIAVPLFVSLKQPVKPPVFSAVSVIHADKSDYPKSRHGQ